MEFETEDDVDLDEDETSLIGGQYQSMTKEDIIKLRDDIGKTNTQYNPYNLVLTRCAIYEEEGLTPAIFYNVMSGGFVVSSEESYEGKFN